MDELPGQPVEVAADAGQLGQALTNVLNNAYKYSPGGGEIRLSLENRVQHGVRQVGIRVRDQGIGMTPAQQARVFERFYRADPSGPIPGTGLGMSLVKEIVELHDGQVEIDSEPGAGTTVTLWLPVHAGVKDPDQRTVPHPPR
jgi:signal transduction histidine kinase